MHAKNIALAIFVTLAPAFSLYAAGDSKEMGEKRSSFMRMPGKSLGSRKGSFVDLIRDAARLSFPRSTLTLAINVWDRDFDSEASTPSSPLTAEGAAMVGGNKLLNARRRFHSQVSSGVIIGTQLFSEDQIKEMVAIDGIDLDSKKALHELRVLTNLTSRYLPNKDEPIEDSDFAPRSVATYNAYFTLQGEGQRAVTYRVAKTVEKSGKSKELRRLQKGSRYYTHTDYKDFVVRRQCSESFGNSATQSAAPIEDLTRLVELSNEQLIKRRSIKLKLPYSQEYRENDPDKILRSAEIKETTDWYMPVHVQPFAREGGFDSPTYSCVDVLYMRAKLVPNEARASCFY